MTDKRDEMSADVVDYDPKSRFSFEGMRVISKDTPEQVERIRLNRLVNDEVVKRVKAGKIPKPCPSWAWEQVEREIIAKEKAEREEVAERPKRRAPVVA